MICVAEMAADADRILAITMITVGEPANCTMEPIPISRMYHLII